MATSKAIRGGEQPFRASLALAKFGLISEDAPLTRCDIWETHETGQDELANLALLRRSAVSFPYFRRHTS
jgi:hypothetical protein